MKVRNQFIQSCFSDMGWTLNGEGGTYSTSSGEKREYVVLTRPSGVSNKLEGRVFQLLAKAEARRKAGEDPTDFINQAKALLN